MSKEKIPNPSELEKELNEYLSKKYGSHIRLSVPFVFPDKNELKKGVKGKTKDLSARINFDMKPEELEAYLNEYVVKQDRAKEILATKICTHFHRIKHSDESAHTGNIKNNIIMIGPTGVGKTFLIKLIAQKIGVPFVKGDATKFSETGYVGGDVEDLVRDLVREADGDIELAQYGIIYIDEIDKIAGSNSLYGPDVSRTGVQRALLKPMEETEVDLKVPHDIVSQMEAVEHYRKTGRREKRVINTKNILFIVSGAFNGLEKIIERRLDMQGIGFGAEMRKKGDKEKFLPMIKAEDLMQYGFESEFIGRLPVVAVFESLEVEDLYAILKNPNSSVMKSKKRDFLSYGIEISFEDNALRAIAEMAYREKTGARGLISALEKTLLKFEKRLPSTEIKKLVVTEAMTQNPAEELKKLISMKSLDDLYTRHEQLIEKEKGELKESILKSLSSLPENLQSFLSDDRLNIIVEHTVKKCLDYREVLDEATFIETVVKDFEKKFYDEHGIKIHFGDKGLNKIIEITFHKNMDVEVMLREIFKNFEHGLKLIRDKTGKNTFIFSEDAIESPQEYLNHLIKQSYQQGE